jgi:hypothetical protein
MKRIGRIAAMALVVGAVAVLVGTSTSYAKRIGGGFIAPCPYWNIYCLDVWDPVICSNGQIYSNDCYALRACQFDCEPWGGFLY